MVPKFVNGKTDHTNNLFHAKIVYKGSSIIIPLRDRDHDRDHGDDDAAVRLVLH